MPRLDVTQCEGNYLRVRVPLMVVNGGSVDENNFVSYVFEQNKTEEEQRRARLNIGITDDWGGGGGYDFQVMGVDVGNLHDGDWVRAHDEQGNVVTAWDVLRRMLTNIIDVIARLPKIKLNSSADRKVEYGTSVTQTLSVTYTDGMFVGEEGYTYGVNAGCEQGTTTFYKNGSAISSTDTSVITDSTTFSASTTYGASTVVPKKNDGTDSSVTISSGTATDSFAITVGKYIFYGNTNVLITDNAEIRQLDSIWSGSATIELPNIGVGFMLVMPSGRVLKTAVTGNNQYLKDDTKNEFDEYLGNNGVTIQYENGETEKYDAYLFVPATAMNTNVTITIE